MKQFPNFFIVSNIENEKENHLQIPLSFINNFKKLNDEHLVKK